MVEKYTVITCRKWKVGDGRKANSEKMVERKQWELVENQKLVFGRKAKSEKNGRKETVITGRKSNIGD